MCILFKKKNNPAECNYEIYDKEMLAMIRCLEEWDVELRGVEQFDMCTDHKNLEYFITVRRLTERQMRWSLILSRYNFRIVHVPGNQNERADALSRRVQDLPKDKTDQRLTDRNIQLLKPEILVSSYIARRVFVNNNRKVPISEGTICGKSPQVLRERDSAILTDSQYTEALKAVQIQARKFPNHLNLKVSISECSLSDQGILRFREREWFPKEQNLRTRIIQKIHDAVLNRHPGREATYALVARQFFWPGMAKDIRSFVENCDKCGRNKAWRSRRQGFLKPLPIPERIWSEISMDFITD